MIRVVLKNTAIMVAAVLPWVIGSNDILRMLGAPWWVGVSFFSCSPGRCRPAGIVCR